MENGSTLYGFAFLDYATLKFWVGYIRDDASCVALGALLMQVSGLLPSSDFKFLDLYKLLFKFVLQVSPKEVIYESQGQHFHHETSICAANLTNLQYATKQFHCYRSLE